MERSRSRDRDSDDRGSRRSSRDDDSRSSRSSRDSDDRDRDRDRDAPSRTSGSSEGYRYEGRSRETIDKRAKMRGKEFDRFVKDGIKTFTPRDGVNRFRILPPTWKGADHYGMDLYVHYSVGPDKQSFLDLAKMQDKPDPISEERAEALRDGDDKYAKELESKRRCGVYGVDRDSEKDGVQFWAMPWTLDADLNKLSVDKRNGEILNIDDPDEGFDIEFEKTGKGISTKYEAVAIARRSSPLGDKRWLDFAIDNPLPEQLVYYDYEHIAKAFGAGGSHRGREDEREERGERDTDRDSRSSRESRGSADQERGRERGRDERSPRWDQDEGSRGDRGSSDSRGRDSTGRSGTREPDRDSGRSSRRDEPSHTWESIHDMTIEELESLCESEDALQDINPDKADGRTDLADWICEELKIRKAETSSRRKIEPSGDDDSAVKLRRMREERNR